MNAEMIDEDAAKRLQGRKLLAHLEALEDLQDRLTLAQARAEDDGTRIPIEDVIREFGI